MIPKCKESVNSSKVVHNNKLLSNILSKYVMNSNNYVDITKEYTGSGTFAQQMINIISPWDNTYYIDKVRYMRLRIFYIQNPSYSKPWNAIVVGRNKNGDNWSKRDFFNSNAVIAGANYNIYEKVIQYTTSETLNTFINFIFESGGCGCTIKYIEFCEVIPIDE